MSMYDLTVLLSSDGKEWDTFLKEQLNKSPQVRHQSIDLDQLEYENPPEVTMACEQSAVLLLLVTPQMLEFLELKCGWFCQALQRTPYTSAVVLFMLLDSDASDKLYDVTKNKYVWREWVYVDPGYEVREVRRTIAKVLDIVEKCQTARKTAEEAQKEATRDKADQKQEGDTEGERGATCVQTDTGGDRWETEKERQEGETAETSCLSSVKNRTFSRPPVTPRNQVQLFPSVIYEDGVRVAIVFREDVKGDVTLRMEQTDMQLTADRENDKVFTFVVPELAPGKHNMLVMEDGNRRWRCSVTMRGLETGVFTSPHYLCQALGVQDLHHLDLKLKDAFNTSLPPSTLTCLLASENTEPPKQSEALYPTLLHYAAAHGLSEFCAALLECPGSSHANCIRNCDGRDPAELAASAGFEDLENYIIDFTEMLIANEIYDHYITSQPSSDPGSDTEDYEEMPLASVPRPRGRVDSEPALPVTPLVAPSLPPRPHKSVSSLETTESHEDRTYLAAGRPDRPPLPPPRSKDALQAMSLRHTSSPCLPSISEVEQKASTLPTTSRTHPAKLTATGIIDTLPKGALGSRSQSELIQLNEMVKSQEINMNEARMLYNAWHHRYGRTPSSSFRDRQKELSDIKAEYLKTREKLTKEDKPSRSFFSRLWLGGRQSKPTVKLHITEPVLERQRKKGPRVYSKSGSYSQLSCSDRASNASTASSSSSSRDSGWSLGSQDSSLSTSTDCDSENRLSLGHLYLQQMDEEEKTKSTPATPPLLPPRTHRPPLFTRDASAGPVSEHVNSEQTTPLRTVNRLRPSEQ